MPLISSNVLCVLLIYGFEANSNHGMRQTKQTKEVKVGSGWVKSLCKEGKKSISKNGIFS